MSTLTNLTTLDLHNNELRSVPEGMSALTNLTYLDLDGNTGLQYPPYSLVKGTCRNVAEEVKEYCGTHTHAKFRREVLWPQIRLLYIGNTDSSCCDTLGCLPVELIWVSEVCCRTWCAS